MCICAYSEKNSGGIHLNTSKLVGEIVERFTQKIEVLSSGKIENLTIKEMKNVRDFIFYSAIDEYIMSWEEENYDMKSIGEFVFLLKEDLASVCADYVS